jgi:flagellar motor switch/type III secretory pathway protein FliN
VLGELGADPDWRERTFIEIDRLAFEIESQAVCGSLCVWGENGMAMHGDERGGAVSLGDRGVLMRLDLGDIDLSLDEIVALRAGSVIELEGGTPLRCFMRVGSTVLAEGEVSVKDARLIVRVVSVLS